MVSPIMFSRITRKISLVSAVLTASLLVCSTAAAATKSETPVDRVSKSMADFVDQLSNVKCSERVTQFKLDKNGHTEYSEESRFDYLVLLQASNDEMMLNESRLPEKLPDPSRKEKSHEAEIVKKNVPMLLTNGFSTMLLIFHPYYRNSFGFTLAGEEMIDGRRMLRVQFEHIPGTRTPAALSVRGKEFPLDLKGTAWIDPATAQVARIDAGLEKDMSDVGLKSLSIEVNYHPLQLHGWPQPYRFPSDATITVETLRQHWRNVHQFSKYQLFTVETESTVADQTKE